MSKIVERIPADAVGRGFVASEYLKDGEDENRFRFKQLPNDGYRPLATGEIEELEANGNRCPDWSLVLVADPFDPGAVRDSYFAGLCRLGPFGGGWLRYHDFTLPDGVHRSRIISSDIMGPSSVTDCGFVSHYIIRPDTILYRVGELQTTDHAKFGVGIVKEGEDESVRVEIDLMNETGGRGVLPFAGMNSADAWIWAKFRDRAPLMAKLREFTEREAPKERGVYGVVGEGSVIKSCHTIKDVDFGPACYAKGCNKLKNLTVMSSAEEPAQLGEGIELVNGIVGPGCRVFYGSKAVRFVMGAHSNLKYGARLIHSYLGDNSTVSCCEVLNNLIFPFHEEHHNNSFLIASLVMGQSNLAAGATVGSNHNSRRNDGELVAGRGFWPALAATVKHDSRFASFTLLAKGSYPAEMDIPLPFSMVTDNPRKGRREVMPAYWWLHNMYALARNCWKFASRDKRRDKPVAIETDFLAPDTANEIAKGLLLLEKWCGECSSEGRRSSHENISIGREILSRGQNPSFEVLAEGLERTNVKVKILKPAKAWAAYRDMLLFYAMREVNSSGRGASGVLASPGPMEEWLNMGGQLVPEEKLDALLSKVERGEVGGWPGMRAEYKRLAGEYPEDKLRHAAAVLRFLAEGPVTEELYLKWDARCRELNDWIRQEAVATRHKDDENPFRHITYANGREREAVLGPEVTQVEFTLPNCPPGRW